MGSLGVVSLTLIDCRYPFEFRGGHIRGASNIYMPQQLEERFLSNPPTPSDNLNCCRDVVIFYCEMSSQRAPRVQNHLRNLDRSLHVSKYPALSYPHIFLLDGGYRRFHSIFGCTDLCEPQGYIQMRDPAFSEELRQSRGVAKGMELQRKRAKYNDPCARRLDGNGGRVRSLSMPSF